MDAYLKPRGVEGEYGFTVQHLAQMRFRGEGPRYYKPTPRVVLYTRDDIEEWIKASVRTGTALEAS